jgi:ABC-type branched-subunit amino acid transport system ATPase component
VEPLLGLTDVTAGYGKTSVLHGISLDVAEGEIVAMVGHNGAGKTAILRTAMGLLFPWSGTVRFAGQDVTRLDPSGRVRAGLSLVPQGSNTFPDLSVAENVELSLAFQRTAGDAQERVRFVYDLFPSLEPRQRQRASSLSAGERQMLAIAIALVKRPRLLLLDEPSLGLAPVLVTRLMDTIAEINRRLGTAVLVAEQNMREALRVAHRAFVIHTGQVVLVERAATLGSRDDLFSLVIEGRPGAG